MSGAGLWWLFLRSDERSPLRVPRRLFCAPCRLRWRDPCRPIIEKTRGPPRDRLPEPSDRNGIGWLRDIEAENSARRIAMLRLLQHSHVSYLRKEEARTAAAVLSSLRKQRRHRNWELTRSILYITIGFSRWTLRYGVGRALEVVGASPPRSGLGGSPNYRHPRTSRHQLALAARRAADRDRHRDRTASTMDTRPRLPEDRRAQDPA